MTMLPYWEAILHVSNSILCIVSLLNSSLYKLNFLTLWDFKHEQQNESLVNVLFFIQTHLSFSVYCLLCQSTALQQDALQERQFLFFVDLLPRYVVNNSSWIDEWRTIFRKKTDKIFIGASSETKCEQLVTFRRHENPVTWVRWQSISVAWIWWQEARWHDFGDRKTLWHGVGDKKARWHGFDGKASRWHESDDPSLVMWQLDDVKNRWHVLLLFRRLFRGIAVLRQQYIAAAQLMTFHVQLQKKTAAETFHLHDPHAPSPNFHVNLRILEFYHRPSPEPRFKTKGSLKRFCKNDGQKDPWKIFAHLVMPLHTL